MLGQQWVALLAFTLVAYADNTTRAAALKNHGECSGISSYHLRAPQAKVVLFQPTLAALISKKLT